MTAEQQNQIYELRKQGLGYGQIADKINSTKNAVRLFCRRQNIAEEFAVCKECGQPYQKKRASKASAFCSKSCYEKWWRKVNPGRRTVYRRICPVCEKSFEAASKKSQKYCSRACFYESRRNGGSCDE